MTNGIININKPTGISSFQVVSIVRRVSKVKKVGHLGTLDPLASGVLPIAVGKATKLFDYFLTKRKSYRAYFYFGKETDTLDSEGEIINSVNKIITMDMIKNKLCNFIGKISQIPPKYSSKMVNGNRAYDLARKNVEFELTPSNIEIYRFEVIDEIAPNLFLFNIDCSAGCYIRSLCRDLAYELGTVAYMPLLIRVEAGQFKIEDSVDLNTIKNCDSISQFLIPIENVLPYQKVYLDENDSKKIKNGLSTNTKLNDGDYLLFDCKKQFFALGFVLDKKLKMEIYFGD